MAREFKLIRRGELPEIRSQLADIRKSLTEYGRRLITVRTLQQILRANGIELTEEAIRVWRRKNYVIKKGVGKPNHRLIWLTTASILRFLDRLEKKAEKNEEDRDIKKNQRGYKPLRRPKRKS